VVFARDCGSGRVTIDGQGRPRVHYWPTAETSEHILEVRCAALQGAAIACPRVAFCLQAGRAPHPPSPTQPNPKPQHPPTHPPKTHNSAPNPASQGMELAMRSYMAAGAVSATLPHAFGHLTAHRSEGQEGLERVLKAARDSGVKLYDMPLFSAHQMGSCRMGASKRWGWRSLCARMHACMAAFHMAVVAWLHGVVCVYRSIRRYRATAQKPPPEHPT